MPIEFSVKGGPTGNAEHRGRGAGTTIQMCRPGSAAPGMHFQVGVVAQGAHRQQRATLASLEPVYGPLVAPVRPGARDDRLELSGVAPDRRGCRRLVPVEA